MNILKNENKFYVYIHRKKTDNEVFYVGKGNKRRAFLSTGRNDWWHRTANKHGWYAELVEKDMYEDDAFILEAELIKFYRECGHPLVNICDGGRGNVRNYIKVSEETKRKQKEIQLSKCLQVACSNGMIFGNKILAVSWLKLNGHPKASAAHIARCCNGYHEEAYQLRWRFLQNNVIDNSKHKIDFNYPVTRRLIECSNGLLFKRFYDAAEWLKTQGVTHALSSSINKCTLGAIPTCYGYSWKIVQSTCTNFRFYPNINNQSKVITSTTKKKDSVIVINEKIDAIFKEVMKTNNLKNYNDLARFLNMSQGYITGLKNSKTAAGAVIILALHEKAGLSVTYIRECLNMYDAHKHNKT